MGFICNQKGKLGDKMKSFFERYQPVFEIVARLLGNGWRVNLLDDCQYRIKLTTPELKRYAITVREEKAAWSFTALWNPASGVGMVRGVPCRPHGVQRV